MSGFSPAWLALREPADHAARDRDLAAALGRAMAARGESVRVLDLGCGTGSNLRALAGLLPARQDWLLVDHDPALLGAARAALIAFADRAEARGDDLLLSVAGRALSVAFRRADLADGLVPLLAPAAPPDLVTAAALFDLVSEPWIAAASDAVARAGALFYTALTFDGAESWTPPHPDDAAIHAAFLAHQDRDKGFGPAAGPRATRALEAAFLARGYAVAQAESPWRVGAGPLQDALAAGKAAAATETGLVPAERVAAWRAARAGRAGEAVIGHRDLLALPPG
ncbi:class I SAM-dependent methyltransferase [Methylobacterium sp. WSM2598]|uniref:class I SAM-dependent methyltransferase n=1 Tax=Methylobacterium sp. WSM2598 TaxID=398261 RepID=UPI00036BFC9A|nr:class I SAM-dependent methyltransferase [Methylobacterium sp. WSM2598]